MPRYFFHVDDGTFMPDTEGTELADQDAARTEAVIVTGAIINELDGAFWGSNSAWRMHVTDEGHRLLFTLRFSSDVPSGDVVFIPPPAESIGSEAPSGTGN
jgi:hypothetical protein